MVGPGGDAGLLLLGVEIAYADFVTAMMALFIVLWLTSQSDQVKQMVQAYFTDPVGFEKFSL